MLVVNTWTVLDWLMFAVIDATVSHCSSCWALVVQTAFVHSCSCWAAGPYQLGSLPPVQHTVLKWEQWKWRWYSCVSVLRLTVKSCVCVRRCCLVAASRNTLKYDDVYSQSGATNTTVYCGGIQSDLTGQLLSVFHLGLLQACVHPAIWQHSANGRLGGVCARCWPLTGGWQGILKIARRMRASSDSVLATKSERKILASTCLYSLYAWFNVEIIHGIHQKRRNEDKSKDWPQAKEKVHGETYMKKMYETCNPARSCETVGLWWDCRPVMRL